MDGRDQGVTRLTSIFQIAAIVLAAALLCLPCLIAGIPSGWDWETHSAYQFHFTRQFWNGDFYPRWLTGANKGLGSPIFLAQYPLPYFITALLRPILPFASAPATEARELGIFFFLAFVAAGIAARAWLRGFCSSRIATIGAIIYLALPYTMEALYTRTALGEACAFVLMPLALALSDRFKDKWLAAPIIGLVFGLLILGHLLSAILFAPMLLGYMMRTPRADGESLFRQTLPGLLALGIGGGVAATYLLPLAMHHQLIDVDRLPSIMPSFEMGRWFLYVKSSTVSTGFFLPAAASALCVTALAAFYLWRSSRSLAIRTTLLGVLALGFITMVPELGTKLVEISGFNVTAFETPSDFSGRMVFTAVSTMALGLLAYAVLQHDTTRRNAWLIIVACTAFAMMLPWSAPLWKAVPQLSIVQFPFRIGGILTLAVVGILAAALEGLRGRRLATAILYGATLCAIVGGFLTWRLVQRFRNPETAVLAMQRNVDVMFRSYVAPAHLSEVAKHLGTTLDSFDYALTPFDDTLRANCVGAPGSAKIAQSEPDVLHVTATCEGNAGVRVEQLYSPLWFVSDGLEIHSSADGRIEVSGNAKAFDLHFDTGWPSRYGAIISWLSTLGVLVFVGLRRRYSRSTTPVIAI